MRFTLQELEEKYDVRLDEILGEIKKSKPKKVLLQFPEGLKPFSLTIVDYLEEKTSAKFFIWQGSCFGACDVPETDADLVVQFGHAPWQKRV